MHADDRADIPFRSLLFLDEPDEPLPEVSGHLEMGSARGVRRRGRGARTLPQEKQRIGIIILTVLDMRC